MNDSYFLDTNILIYSIGNIIQKKIVSVNLIDKNAVISTQILSELASVMHRKLKYDYLQIRSVTDKFAEKMALHIITYKTVKTAFDIAEKYGYTREEIAEAFKRIEKETKQ